MDVAGRAFLTFIKATMAPGRELFDREIFYIPGNHDHHLWELARETQYVEWFKRHPEMEELEPPLHTTPLFQSRQARHKIPSVFLYILLTYLSQKPGYEWAREIEIKVRYPNLGIRSGNRLALFTHGHFLETIYQGVSWLRDLFFRTGNPSTIDLLEAQNFAWIDFFWSVLGRSGEAGQSVETIYEYSKSRKMRKRLIRGLADNIKERYRSKCRLRFLSMIIRTPLSICLLNRLFDRERARTDTALSHEVLKGLKVYLAGYLKRELEVEAGDLRPERVSFVFGHTHKPHTQSLPDPGGYPSGVEIYNTGGWVVEGRDPQPVHGGTVVLFDGELNGAALNMYREKAGDKVRGVEVAGAGRDDDRGNPLLQDLMNLVKPDQSPWKEFTETASREVSRLYSLTKGKLNGE